MSTPSRALLLIFTSLLLLITIFFFTPLCHFSPPNLLAKTSSFLKHFAEQVNQVNDEHLVLPGRGLRKYKSRKLNITTTPAATRNDHQADVVVLGGNNFSDFIVRNEYVLVDFYAPWCYWSNRLAPEYGKVANLLKGEATVAKIDCAQETELCREFKILGYPTVILFVGGVQNSVYDPQYERTRDAIASWVRMKMVPVVQDVATAEEADPVNLEFLQPVEDHLAVHIFNDTEETFRPMRYVQSDNGEAEVTEPNNAEPVEIEPYNGEMVETEKDNGEMVEIEPDNHTRIVLNDVDQGSSPDMPIILNNFVNHEDIPKKAAVHEDVVVLTNDNFTDFFSRNPVMMVTFYASWCYWSQRLLPEYAAAATMLKGEFVLAKVDASEETELGRKYHIQGYPTLYLMSGNDQKVPYYGERSRYAIATWLRNKVGLGTLKTIEDAKHMLDNGSVIVLGILNNLEGPESEELAAASKLHVDVDFYQTANVDVLRFFHIDLRIERPALVILKDGTGNPTSISLEGIFTRSAIADFVSIHKRTSVVTFTEEVASSIFNNPLRTLFLFAPDQYPWEVMAAFTKVADTFRGKLLFVFVRTNDVGERVAHQFGVSPGDPTVVAYNADGTKTYIYHGDLTFDGIKSFAKKFLEDEVSIRLIPFSEEGLITLPDPALIPHTY